MHNLIPNGSFEAGLSEWEATPSGVTLIKTEAKRFVMLQAGTRSAAICSDPISVRPGAAYVVEIERAMRGDCEIAVISPTALIQPDHAGEIIPDEDKVRVQITARPGEKVGIAKVLLVPVGERLQIEGVRSTAGFRKSGEPFEILCDVRNTGSQIVGGAVARLVTDQHELMEEYRQDQPIAALDVGEKRTVSWPIAKQKAAYSRFQIELEYSGNTEAAAGTTLRHLPRPPEVKLNSGAATGRRWYSVRSRALRLTAHETDLDYAPAMLTTVAGTELGILPALAQLVLPGGGVIPLWSKLKQSTPAGIELIGKNEWMEWSILVRADVSSRGAGIDLKATGKKRVPGVRLELLPFQTLEPMGFGAGAVTIAAGKEAARIAWAAASPRLQFKFVVTPESGLALLRSEPFVLSPTLLRATASIHPSEKAIAKSG